MKTITIKGDSRKELGSKVARRLRRKGNVPCVLYGAKETRHFTAPEKSFREILTTPDKCIAELDIDGKSFRSIVKESQYDPISDRLLHVDFQELQDDKKVITVIPIKPVGKPVGVTDGGHLITLVRDLKVRALPKDLVDFIEVDVSDLAIGKSVKVGELRAKFPQLEILVPATIPLAAVEAPRALVEVTPAAVAAEGAVPAEGAEAAAGEGKEEGEAKKEGKKEDKKG